MIVTCQQMQQIEADAFARGVSASELMEEAGRGIADVIRQFFPKPGLVVLYLGKGNNAGDALVAGLELLTYGWRVAARLSVEPAEMKELPRRHWAAFGSDIERWNSAVGEESFVGQVVLLDGLLGIGAQGGMAAPLRSLAAEMNALRRTRHAFTIAMDIPSGLNGDTGEPYPDAVVADLTVTVAQVKVGLLADSAAHHVGRLALVPLHDLTADDDASAEIVTSKRLRPILPRRSFDMHKGLAGRVAIVAGSRGFLGAAVLSSLGAMRGGAGLITLYTTAEDYELLAIKMPPEIMVKPVSDYREATNGSDVIAVGPGLGFASQNEVLEIIRDAKQPVVVDADALTMLGKTNCEALAAAYGPRLVTPHPGEMERLVPGSQSKQRVEVAEQFVAKLPHVTLLLKGSRTVIASQGHRTWLNTTGTPAMACGGMGDVLTGLCAALIAQGMPIHEAAGAGSWLLGRAAECAQYSGVCSAESLSATDVAAHLGQAFDDLRAGVY